MTRLTTPETDAALEGAWPAPGPRIIFAEEEPERADAGTDWPIACLHVGDQGELTATFYAPALPPGKHDVWCLPVDAAEELARLRATIDQLRQQVAHFETLALRARSAAAGR